MERREERLRREVSFFRELVEVMAVLFFCDGLCNRTSASHMTKEGKKKDKKKS
jgi:hypothetical protein